MALLQMIFSSVVDIINDNTTRRPLLQVLWTDAGNITVSRITANARWMALPRYLNAAGELRQLRLLLRFHNELTHGPGGLFWLNIYRVP